MTIWSFVGLGMVLVPAMFLVLESVRLHGIRTVLGVFGWMVASVLILIWIVVAILLIAGKLP